MLESIIGQKVVKRMLLNEIKREALPQTLLFFGPDGSGKFLTALEIARIVNCLNDGSDSCNCEACHAIRRLNSPNLLILSKANLKNSFDIWFNYGVDSISFPFFYRDVMRLIVHRISAYKNDKSYNKDIEEINLLRESLTSYEIFKNIDSKAIFDIIDRFLIDSKDNTITIDEIRNIQRFLQHSSGLYKKKVVIIDGAEYMNEEAANSFLKISEDTPENSIIIMTAVNKKRIKDTIVSRARNYRFIGLTIDEMKEVLYRLYNRDIFYDERKVRYEEIKSIFKKIVDSRDDYDAVFNLIQDILRDGKEINIVDYLESLYMEKIRQCETLSIEDIYELEIKLKELAEERRKLKSTNVNRELSFANFIINEQINLQ